MKIDCSNVLNFANEYTRMCEYYTKEASCDACPLRVNADCILVTEVTQESINIVQKWSDEHPHETMADRFFKMFPNAPTNDYGTPKSCPDHMGWVIGGCYIKGDKVMTCKDCWNRPYIEGGAK